MCAILKNVVADDTGSIFTEYGLLAVLIAVVAVGAVVLFGESVLVLFQRLDPSVFD